MWDLGAELTRDQWIANGSKDNAIHQLTRAWQQEGWAKLPPLEYMYP
jgi:hypothetical protein